MNNSVIKIFHLLIISSAETHDYHAQFEYEIMRMQQTQNPCEDAFK